MASYMYERRSFFRRNPNAGRISYMVSIIWLTPSGMAPKTHKRVFGTHKLPVDEDKDGTQQESIICDALILSTYGTNRSLCPHK